MAAYRSGDMGQHPFDDGDDHVRAAYSEKLYPCIPDVAFLAKILTCGMCCAIFVALSVWQKLGVLLKLLEVDDELIDVEHDVIQGYSNTWGRGLDRETIKTRLLQREYEVEIKVWFSRAWYLYTNHWKVLSIWAVIYLALSFCIPFVGGIVSVFWYAGLVAVGCDLIRTTNPSLHIRFLDLVPTLFIALPVYFIFFTKAIVIVIGLIFFIVPGLYLAVVLQMAIPLYIEFHRDEMTMIDALLISRNLVHKQFWGMALFLVAVVLGGLSGVLLLGVGLLITLPVSTLAVCIALSDIFGLRDTHLYAVGASVVGDDFATD